jgi:hypothetical protein
MGIRVPASGLIPYRVAVWARPPSSSARNQRRCAEWADRIGSGLDRRKSLSQRWLLRSAKQINEKQNCSCREGDSEDPTDHAKIGIARAGPHNQRNGNRANQAQPFEEPANLRVSMWRLTTNLASPSFPKAHRQNWDPEDVPHVEGPDGDGPSRRLTSKAIVIAKGNSLWPEMVGAANEEHGASSETVQPYGNP